MYQIIIYQKLLVPLSLVPVSTLCAHSSTQQLFAENLLCARAVWQV